MTETDNHVFLWSRRQNQGLSHCFRIRNTKLKNSTMIKVHPFFTLIELPYTRILFHVIWSVRPHAWPVVMVSTLAQMSRSSSTFVAVASNYNATQFVQTSFYWQWTQIVFIFRIRKHCCYRSICKVKHHVHATISSWENNCSKGTMANICTYVAALTVISRYEQLSNLVYQCSHSIQWLELKQTVIGT